MFSIEGDYEPPCHEYGEEQWKHVEVGTAVKLCQSCPLQMICLARTKEYEELTQQLKEGVYGGVPPHLRAAIQFGAAVPS